MKMDRGIMSHSFKRQVTLLLGIVIALLYIPMSRADQPTFASGDVFAAVGDGKVNWHRPDGTLNRVLDTGQSGLTAGMAFDTAGALYVTGFTANGVSWFDISGKLLGTFGNGYGDNPESIVFDKAGNAYVGHAGPEIAFLSTVDRTVKRFDPTGKSLAQFNVSTESRGSDWIDLAADQCTLYYTSEGSTIKRFDVCTNAQRSDFASGLRGTAYALRILPGGGVLVADNLEVYRLDAKGTIVKTYDVPGEDCWFALNRDPDGRSFWSGDLCRGNFYKFDIESGKAVLGPIHACDRQGCLSGLAVFGEITEAAPASITLNLPPWLLFIPLLLLLLIALIWWLRWRPSPGPALPASRPLARSSTMSAARPVKRPGSGTGGADVTHGRDKPPTRSDS